MIRNFIFAALLAAIGSLTTLSGLAYGDSFLEPKTDRPGNDYSSFTIKKITNSLMTQYELCRTRCKNDFLKCDAWTLVDAGAQGPDARCYLKKGIPAPRPCAFCTSGVPERTAGEMQQRFRRAF